MDAVGMRREIVNALTEYYFPGGDAEPYADQFDGIAAAVVARPALQQLAGAVARAEKAEAELRRAEPILVAADRIHDAYEAMLDGRDIGRLPEWER